MIASLAMYDRPELAGATDRYWQEIAKGCCAAGIDAPPKLERDTPFWEVWTAPDLLLSQTCGRPYRKRLHGKVSLIGTPDYGLARCPPGFYRSAFVTRKSDPRRDLVDFAGDRFAFNEVLSQSGWSAPQVHVENQGFRFDNLLETGGHRHSAKSVAENDADIAAIDSLTWDILNRFEPFAEDLRVLEWTTPSPGLPYITARHQDAGALADIVAAAIGALAPADRDALSLRGFVRFSPADYLGLPDPRDDPV